MPSMSYDAQIQHNPLNALEPNNDNLDVMYQLTLLKLHECASHEPGQDLQKDFEIEQLEHKWMSAQEEILEQAVKLKIETNEDFKVVSNIWNLEAGLTSHENLSYVERLTMSLNKFFAQRILASKV